MTRRPVRRVLLAVTVVSLVGACGRSTSNNAEKDRYAPAYAAVCRTAADLRAGNLDAAKADFYDTAHLPIHELAASLEAKHRDVAARLLEAKQPVEAGLIGTESAVAVEPLATHLSRVMADAMASAGGDRPKPCPK